ncbi:MAG: hypothetical protein ABFS10_00675 [Bacteroidota bacterium]
MLLYQYTLQHQRVHTLLEVSNLSEGLYLSRIYVNNGFFATRKVMKQS